MRAFVAVDVIRPEAPNAEGERAPAHFTLLFLGDLAAELAAPLARALEARAAREAPFRVAFGSVGAFPDAMRPRVVFLSVLEGADGLERLAQLARAAADEVSARYDDRPFVPHLTLFRVRGARERDRARELVGRPLASAPPPFVVDRLLLKESQLDRSGATHTVRAACPLASSSGLG